MRSVALFLALSCSALALPQAPANGAGNSNRPEHPHAIGHPNNSNHPHASPSGALAPSTATSSPGSETPTKTLSSTDTRGAWTYETLAPGQAPTKPNNAPLPEIPVFPPSTASPAFILPKFSEPAWGAFWSYSQPPVPATSTTQAPPSQFTASFTDEDIAAQPTTREYTFNMTYAAGWPSGYLRRLAVINSQFPGPLIEANQGDTVVVHVNNHLDVGQSIHWHGIRQNGSNWADGVPGFSQCAIPPGGSFTYRFQLASEVGTFWYHSHYGNTLADGLIGGIIVHSPDDALKRGVDFDEDKVLFLSDWINDDSHVVIHEESDMRKPYRGVTFVPEPDAVLFNGLGQTNCTRATRGVPCGINPYTEVIAQEGNKVRLRLINTGGQALIRFSVDGHNLTVIEADDTAIEPVEMHEVPVGSGQRYSVVVTLDQGKAGDSFWIRGHAGTYCINPRALVNGVAVLRYSDSKGGKVGTTDPTSEPWSDLKNPQTELCRDLDEYVKLTPRIKEDAPPDEERSGIWQADTLFGIFREHTLHTPLLGFGMNGIMYKNMINDPLLQRIFEGRGIPDVNAEVAAVTFNGGGAADIILNVLDPPPIGHPFHLHGRPFYIISRGNGVASEHLLPVIPKNLINPLRRDTLLISQLSYAVIRIKLDDPGIWPLHCHIGWHLAAGKMAAVSIGTGEVGKQPQPEEWKALCAGVDRSVIGPGRRALSNGTG